MSCEQHTAAADTDRPPVPQAPWRPNATGVTGSALAHMHELSLAVEDAATGLSELALEASDEVDRLSGGSTDPRAMWRLQRRLRMMSAVLDLLAHRSNVVIEEAACLDELATKGTLYGRP